MIMCGYALVTIFTMFTTKRHLDVTDCAVLLLNVEDYLIVIVLFFLDNFSSCLLFFLSYSIHFCRIFRWQFHYRVDLFMIFLLVLN